jgi:hypothetical protein
MRSLELFLLQPLPDSAERTRFEGLRRLLSRARTLSALRETLEAALMQRFGVSRQRDWPVAPLARLGDGQEPDTAYWLCADPVHLQVDRDALILVDSHRYELAQTDADSLVSTLNLHFAAAAFISSAPTPKRWYARVAETPDVQTVSVARSYGFATSTRCCPLAATRWPGIERSTRSRCCCTIIRSTKRAKHLASCR